MELFIIVHKLYLIEKKIAVYRIFFQFIKKKRKKTYEKHPNITTFHLILRASF